MKTYLALLLTLFSCGLAAAPRLEFLTYLGGSKQDHAAGDMTTDAHGNIYLTGPTKSADFPVTPGAFDTSFNDTSGNTDAFVMKLDPSGKILWSTFIGSPTRDEFDAIKVDKDGYVYLAGAFGPGAPTTPGAVQTVFAGGQGEGMGGWDGYLVKLKPDGSGLVWATYLGSAADDALRDMDLAPDGTIVVGTRYSGKPWPRRWFSGSFQERPQGGVDAVIIKVSGDGKRVVWASYLGGSKDEAKATNLSVDKAGNVDVLTYTASADMPTTPGAYDRTYHGATDIYLGTLSPDGKRLLMGTYLGSPEADGAGGKRGIQIAPDGTLVISGWTRSHRFPTTPGAARATPLEFTPWGGTGITACFSPHGQLLGSTYIGDSEGLSLDSAGNAYITTKMWSDVLPVSPGALQSEWRGGPGGDLLDPTWPNSRGDGALVVLSADLRRVLYATYLGGSGDERAAISAVGPDDSIVVAGQTTSTDLPVLHAAQPKYAGGIDVFLLKLSPLITGPAGGRTAAH